ncbi:MAG: CHAT domain-containing protein [Potamolinea sp.]
MNTFEITIQRKLGNNWPIVIEYTRSGILLPLRSEGTLKLNQEDFGHLISLQLQPQNYGTVLGKALFQDEIRDAFIAAIRESQESLRVLLFIEAVDKELRILRWERLCVPIDNSWSLLALNQRVPFSLYIPATTDRRFPPIGRRDLRALILVASPSDSKKYNLAEFDVEATVKSVKSALGEIPTDVLATVESAIGLPTLDELIKHLNDRTKQYTILHFVSHGRMNKDSETVLYWSKADNTVEVVTATRLLEQLSLLRGARGLPHFTFLSTCESASPEAEAGLGGFGQRLVRDLGMPAVVAMTEKVTIKTAQALAENFYRKLQESGEVDSALQEASATLAERQDITVPALFSRLGGRLLFSDQLDRDLTNAEITYGLDRLQKLLQERSPLLLPKLKLQAQKLAHTLEADTTALSQQANNERSQALEEVNNLCQEVLDLSFNSLALGKQPPIYDSRCPFLGLYPFRVENHEFFFGREALIAQLEQQLTKHKFLAIFGASGSGKSSVVLAGLIPFLQKKQSDLVMVYLTPSSNPIQQLEVILPQLQNQTSIIVIDQFEELFTLCTDQSLRLEFIQKFLILVKEQLVVITMRADFWGECASYPELKELMQSRQELIGPMDSTELRKAMELQAIQVGLRFEASLSNSILDDVQGEPGAMPLLQHALLELWKRRHGKWLRSDEYEAIGGVTRAIAQTADDFYNKLSEEQQEQIKNIFVRLTRLDETTKPGEKRRDTRRRVWLEELIPLDSNQEMTKNLLKRLAGEGARLVVTSVDSATNREEVEVAHEALIRYWPRLLNWLDENRTLLEQRETIRKAALEWEEQQKEENYLEHRGERLEKAQVLLKQANFLNQLEANYVKACVELRERLQQEKAIVRRREVRKNWAIASGIVVTVVTTSLGVIAWTKGYEAEINKADSLSKNALLLSKQNQSLKALVEGIKAAKIIKSKKQWAVIDTLITGTNVTHNEGTIIQSQIIAALHKALNGAQDRNRLIGHKSSVRYLEFIGDKSSNDTTIITRSNDQTFKLWNLKTGQEVKRHPLDHPEEFTKLALSNDGKNLVSVAQDQTVKLWNSKADKLGKKLPIKHQEKVNSIDFSPNGKTLASASEDKTVKLWDLEGKLLQTFPHQEAVKSIDFSPDGKTLLSMSADKNFKPTFKLWNLKGKLLKTYESDVTQVQFSPDPKFLVSVSEDNKNFKLWDLKGKLLQSYESDVTDVHFSPGGKLLLSESWVSQDNNFKKTFKLWNLEGQFLKTYESDITEVVFSPDDQLVVSVNEDKKTFKLWNSKDKSQHTYKSDVTKVIFSPDSSTLASANTDNTVRPLGFKRQYTGNLQRTSG